MKENGTNIVITISAEKGKVFWPKKLFEAMFVPLPEMYRWVNFSEKLSSLKIVFLENCWSYWAETYYLSPQESSEDILFDQKGP